MHERHEARVGDVAARHDDRLDDVGVGVEHGLDLAELDAVTADLDLVVGPAGELDETVRVDAHHVASRVDASESGPVDEPRGRELVAAVVAPGDALAADVELAEHADRHRQPASSSTNTVLLPIGRPIGIEPSATSEISWTSDQIVVSVGPYMFVNRPGRIRRSSPASAVGRASPPTIMCRIEASACPVARVGQQHRRQ